MSESFADELDDHIAESWADPEYREACLNAAKAEALREAADQIENTGALTNTVSHYLRLKADEYYPEND